MFEPYGSEVWSNDLPPKEGSYLNYGLGLGALAGAGAFGAGYALAGDETYRRIDSLAFAARAIGNFSPLQVGNTFRLPEFLSPFLSAKEQGLKEYSGTYIAEFDARGFDNTSSWRYLEELTGKSSSELAEFGLGPSAQAKASSLIFARDENAITGRLLSVVDGYQKILSENVMLMSASNDHYEILNPSSKQGINRATHAIFQAMDMWKHQGFNADEVGKFSDVDKATGKLVSHKAKFIPVPGFKGFTDPSSLGDTWRSTTYARSFSAFNAERFNRLLKTSAENILGESGAAAVRKLVGSTGEVLPGPGSTMFFRFGGKMALAGGAILAVNEADWIRRQGGAAGHAVVSAGVGAAVAGAAYKMGFKKTSAFMAGSAAFFGQTILPGFDQGIIQGLATTWANATLLRANPANAFSHYRRTLEGFLPGVTDWKVGALAGLAALGVAYGYNPVSNKRGADYALEFFKKYGSNKHIADIRRAPLSVRDNFYNIIGTQTKTTFTPELKRKIQEEIDTHGRLSARTRFDMMNEFNKKSGSYKEGLRSINQSFSLAEAAADLEDELNPLNAALTKTLKDINSRYAGQTDWFSRGMRYSEGLLEQVKFGLMGATPHKIGKEIADLGFTAPLGKAGLVFGAGFLAHGLLTGGLFGSMETQEDLEEIYQGRKYVKVGKSRWWEGGGTPFEGSKTEYYRPHAYALMMNRVREKGIWGEDEDQFSPTMKFMLKNFTYYLEEKNYYDRPYPQASAAFQDIPIIGNVLAAGIGSLIKAPKLMHTEEWMRFQENGGVETMHRFEGWQKEPGYAIGAPPPGVPATAFQSGQVISRYLHQTNELSGLTGWAQGQIANTLFGKDAFIPSDPVLANAGMMTSPGRRYWEMALGGGFFQTEAIRRVFPQYEKQLKSENPIMNTMPSWLPDSFHYGDPYTKTPWGEARLPGAGYVALHPELQGFDPEDYPLIYQYDILANVAPFSKELSKTKERLYKARLEGRTSETENQMMDNIDTMLTERLNIYNFDKFNPYAYEVPGGEITRAAWAKGKNILRDIVAPAEYMIPFGFRPISKLLGDRDPIEQYEYERLYGTPMAFWDKPWRDWFRPAIYSTLHMMGWQGKPAWREEADRTNEYFDKLQFIKYMQLSDQARREGRGSDAIKYEYLASGTRMGVNPQGNPMGIYWSIPDQDRPYFNAFALATGGDRRRILEMVPEDQQHLYQAVWSRLDAGEDLAAMGFDRRPDTAYLRDQYAIAQAYEDIPPTDWIGFNSEVDLSDIKAKYVSNLGRELSDFGLWENQVKKANQQPYLEGSDEPIRNVLNRSSLYRDLHRLGGTRNGVAPQYTISNGYYEMSSVNLTYDDSRDRDILNSLLGALNG